MARTYLNLSDEEFWSSTPQLLYSMIEEYWLVEKTRAYNAGVYFALLNNGQKIDPPSKDDAKQTGTNKEGLALWSRGW